MIKLNYNDLSKQAKIGYNALYNVVFGSLSNNKDDVIEFTVPLCFNSDNKVSLTEKNFIFFDSILTELNLYGFYNIMLNNGRAVDDVKTDFYTVYIVISRKKFDIPSNIKNFDFSDVDLNKLLKRNGKVEKAKTAENKEKENQKQKAAEKNSKELEEQKTAEDTNKKLEEKTAEIQKLKKEVKEKQDQLNKKQIDKFNDEALFSIADCIEFLVKKHCPIPADFDFSTFEADLFKVISAHWDLKILD